jgi:hypothetical protein
MTFITPGKEVSALSAVGRSYRVSRDSTCPQHQKVGEDVQAR